MVKISSTMDKGKRAFKSASQSTAVRGELDDDRPAAHSSDAASLAPGLDGVDGMDESATDREIERGDTTTVTRLVYDEYDESQP